MIGDGLGGHEVLLFGAGLLSSSVVGYLTITLLISFLTNHNLRVFAYYRFAPAADLARAARDADTIMVLLNTLVG